MAIPEKDVGSGFLDPLGRSVVWAIGLGLGGTTGYAINPARDLATQIAHALLPIPVKGPSEGAWVPVVGPMVGGITAAFLARLEMTH